MLEICSGVRNEEEKDGGTRGPVGLWSEGPRWELHYVLSALACARGLNLVVLLLCVSELIDLPVWERAHPLL